MVLLGEYGSRRVTGPQGPQLSHSLQREVASQVSSKLLETQQLMYMLAYL